ncbi:hypothetical protein TUM17576_35760 [Enterobacter hormaechei]|jgi:hypothetical protein|nr:hypothetical protein [Enterobacter hormaechei]MDU6686518.1 hypothetical protein [Enterobacteriaceae bacterium]PTA88764.1 hypothetical protein C9415_24535 [Kluyvera sp. Nf5]GJL41950.1 hypothetical protein TUM17577_31590 [Enterobacter asburiae]MDU7134400.1 hypothetical protein [Enterobacteriaceae bacterium]MDU7197351.1 hypothetical protein [Enterobacteriaceae bacterium]
MLQINGAVRTFILWFTLFLAWSTYVLWHYGADIVKFIFSNSNLFAFDLAMRSVQSTLMPSGVVTFLVVLLVMTAGAVLSTLTLMCCSLLYGLSSSVLMAGNWLLRRAGLVRTPESTSL